MDQAQGQWIAFADSDDEYVPAFTEEALAIALHQDCDLVCGYAKNLSSERTNCSLRSGLDVCVVGNKEFKVPEIDILASQMLAPAKHKKFNGPDFCGRGPWAKLYRASAIANLAFDENISIGEDTLFNYLIIESSCIVSVVKREWYIYYQHRCSASRSIELHKWINSIDGIFRAGSKTQDLSPFQARCAIMSFQFIESLVKSKTFSIHKEDAITLLIHADNQGCFNEAVIESYIFKPWVKHMYKLCSAKQWYQACSFWRLKTKIAAAIKAI
jgi:hypothetical protein